MGDRLKEFFFCEGEEFLHPAAQHHDNQNLWSQEKQRRVHNVQEKLVSRKEKTFKINKTYRDILEVNKK